MSFLKLQAAPTAGYERLRYLKNPFPVSGEVRAELYVERPELQPLQDALNAFLADPPGAGGFWAVAGETGLGKSNFLQHIAHELTGHAAQLPTVVFRYVGSQPLSARNLVEQIVQALEGDRLIRLLSQRPATPPSLRSTDLGRFLDAARQRKADEAAAFLIRWLSGHQTYVRERTEFGVWSKERMPAAVALPYLKDIVDLLAAHGLVTHLLLLLDEFEDIQRLSAAIQPEYVNSLKGLVNVFNWDRLFLILTGQETVFLTIEGRYPSIQSRWRRLTLRALDNADEAVRLAHVYMEDAHRQFLLSQRRLGASQVLTRLADLSPSPQEIKAQWADLIQPGRRSVRQRDLLGRLHLLIEDQVRGP